MMAEQHVAIGRHVIERVVMPVGRGLPRRIDAEDLVGDEQGVEAVGNKVDAHRRDDEPCGIDGLAAAQGNNPQGNCADNDDCRPQQLRLNRIGWHCQRVHRYPPAGHFYAIVQPIDLTTARYFASAGWSEVIISNSRAKSSKKSRVHSSTLLDQTFSSKGPCKLWWSGYDAAPPVSPVAIGITSAATMIS